MLIFFIILIVVVVVVNDDTYYWVCWSSDHQFQVYYKVRLTVTTRCDSSFCYKVYWSVITNCDAFFYYKERQVLLQSATEQSIAKNIEKYRSSYWLKWTGSWRYDFFTLACMPVRRLFEDNPMR